MKQKLLYIIIFLFFCTVLLSAGTYINKLAHKNPLLYSDLVELHNHSIKPSVTETIACNFLNTANPVIKEAFSIIISGHHPHRLLTKQYGDYITQKKVAYQLPECNTALLILAKIYESCKEPQALPIALAISISNSFLYTFGSDEVQKATEIKCILFYSHLKEFKKK